MIFTVLKQFFSHNVSLQNKSNLSFERKNILSLSLKIPSALSLMGVLLFSVCALVLSATATADDAADQDTSNVDWGLDLNLGHQKQSFKRYSAELSNFSVNPSVQVGNWDFTLDLPWYQKKGEFYIDGVRPRLLAKCEKLEGYSVEQIMQMVRNGTIKRTLVISCSALQKRMDTLNATESGVGDITGFARYSFGLGDNTGWSASAGLGYKADSGDSDKGLGSGTQDTQAEFSLGYSSEKNAFNLTLGYDATSGDEAVNGVYHSQDYAYGSLDFSHAFTDWLTLGANFSAQQSYVKNGDTMKSSTGYVDFFPAEHWTLHLYGTDYSGIKGAPDNEYGASVQYSF